MIWGIPYLLIKVADGGVSVAVLVFARVFAGTLLLLPIAIRHGQLRALRPYLRWVLALSLAAISAAVIAGAGVFGLGFGVTQTAI